MNTELEQATAVAIGKFDGIHLGHRKLLGEILEQKKNGLEACVFTFDPTPAVFFGISDGKELTTKAEKRFLLERMGVDILVEYPLNKETAGILPELFVSEILCKKMKIKWIAAGDDLSFGAKGAGNEALLKKMSQELGYRVEMIKKIRLHDIEISSTFIRSQLESGNIQLVNEFLGEPYMVRGIVSHGKKLGRTIGIPTVNVIPETSKLLPPNGVYFSTVFHKGKKYKAISNIGYKPTVAEEKVMGIESYLYDFNLEIYGDEIEIFLHQFHRPEIRFQNLEELKEQMNKDMKAGKIY